MINIDVINDLSTNDFLILNKKFLRYFKDPGVAVFFAYLINNFSYYLKTNSLDENEFFFLKHKRIEEDTGISYHLMTRYIKLLEDKNLIESKLKGWPATKHIKLNLDKIDEVFNNKPIVQKPIKEKRSPKKFFETLNQNINDGDEVEFYKNSDSLQNPQKYYKLSKAFKDVFGKNKFIFNREIFYNLKNLDESSYIINETSLLGFKEYLNWSVDLVDGKGLIDGFKNYYESARRLRHRLKIEM